MRDDDLRDELQFHIDMRVQRHMSAGMAQEDAERLAREQFGDMEAAMAGMRRAHMRSARALLIAVTLTCLAAAGLWVARAAAPPEAMVLPPLPLPPVERKVHKRPPPPPPGPTWEEFVAKVNTFGDGSRAKTPRR